MLHFGLGIPPLDLPVPNSPLPLMKSSSLTSSFTQETAIANLRPGRISKVFLHFNEPFWIPGEGDIIFLWTKKVTHIFKASIL